jgi:hypothetical protein
VKQASVCPLIAVTAIITSVSVSSVQANEGREQKANRPQAIVAQTYSEEGTCRRENSKGRRIGPRGPQLRLHLMPIRKVAEIVARTNSREILFAHPDAQDVVMDGVVCSVDFDHFVLTLSVWFHVDKTENGVRVGELTQSSADCLGDGRNGVPLELTGGSQVGQLVEFFGGSRGTEFLSANPRLRTEEVGGAGCFRDFESFASTMADLFCTTKTFPGVPCPGVVFER